MLFRVDAIGIDNVLNKWIFVALILIANFTSEREIIPLKCEIWIERFWINVLHVAVMYVL